MTSLGWRNNKQTKNTPKTTFTPNQMYSHGRMLRMGSPHEKLLICGNYKNSVKSHFSQLVSEMSEVQIFFKASNILLNHFFYKSSFTQGNHCYRAQTVANILKYFKSSGMELVSVWYSCMEKNDFILLRLLYLFTYY